ncbi:nucleotidyltransferase family protein [Pedobacter duraquae]|uniref:Molybdenum cofactor cytidylyltransferase n=1 Tax=Pedobacter duraquae TaxID=425511 RepID=A0A4R6IBI3_9SPHI|nr:nucleotidyltransferase family protein [Pedobacter duraquae]TDO19563.1 molybdenum cofactor cytidylyltransferase [Pedobacter duraquae]
MSNAVIILAAGNSSRLGRPKQLLIYNGISLLRHTVTAAVQLNTDLVVVVTGAEHGLLLPELKSDPVYLCHNTNWEQGMGTSIATGLNCALLQLPDLQSCILAVCDQPFLSAQTFKELISLQQQTGKGIVASAYADTLGTPVLFERRFFSDLQLLDGSGGAKMLFKIYAAELVTVPFAKGEIDVDTQRSYEALLASAQEKP